jgi:hypothetical protein
VKAGSKTPADDGAGAGKVAVCVAIGFSLAALGVDVWPAARSTNFVEIGVVDILPADLRVA